MTDAQRALAQLIREPPRLHFNAAGPQQWTMDEDVLRWLAGNVSPSWRTLETGCGASSIVLIASGAEHTIVTPEAYEHELVKKWCEGHGFPTDRTTSLVESSTTALPDVEGTLDLGLIDGSHAFPIPFIDWYYIAERLKVGGLLLVDDVQLATCGLLDEFIRTERERWEHVSVIGGRTSVFRKLTEVVISPDDWCGQPWVIVANRTRSPTIRRLRHFLRPRTRLRAVRERMRLGAGH